MDHQLSFADSEFNNKRRQTHKEKSLGRMEKLIPWWRLESVIEPHYPNVGNGRKPYPLFATVCSLSDPAIEDALYEIASMRLFAGFSLDGAIPDHTTIMNFRHLLERYDLACKIFDEISEWLSD